MTIYAVVSDVKKLVKTTVFDTDGEYKTWMTELGYASTELFVEAIIQERADYIDGYIGVQETDGFWKGICTDLAVHIICTSISQFDSQEISKQVAFRNKRAEDILFKIAQGKLDISSLSSFCAERGYDESQDHTDSPDRAMTSSEINEIMINEPVDYKDTL